MRAWQNSYSLKSVKKKRDRDGEGVEREDRELKERRWIKEQLFGICLDLGSPFMVLQKQQKSGFLVLIVATPTSEDTPTPPFHSSRWFPRGVSSW